MTKSVTIITSEKDSTAAGEELGRGIRAGFGGAAADAVIVFASAQHDYQALLRSLAAASGTETIVGSSSAGEFTNRTRGKVMFPRSPCVRKPCSSRSASAAVLPRMRSQQRGRL